MATEIVTEPSETNKSQDSETPSFSIERYNAAKAALERVESLDEVKQIRNQAEAYRAAFHKAKSVEGESAAGELRLRAERRAGELLIKMAEAGERVTRQTAKSTPTNGVDTPTLSELGITTQDGSAWQRLAALPDLHLEEYLLKKRAANEPIYADIALRDLLGKAHVAQATGNNEWYTPPEYIEAAREVMGEIDCDPASSAIANRIVKATTYYTAEDDGLSQKWIGRVWLNPPYAQPLVNEFVDGLAFRTKAGDVTEACVLVNNATDTAWGQILLGLAHAACWIKGRVRFLDAAGEASGAPLQGQVVFYYGPHTDKFAARFRQFGAIWFAEGRQ